MGDTPWYASRESVKRAINVSASAYLDREVDAALGAAVEKIHGDLHLRHFWPQLDTRYFDWPDRQAGVTGILYLGKDRLISATSVTSGDGILLPAEYYLRPDTGPPYRQVEVNLASSSGFTSAMGGPQRAVAIVGLWGWTDDDMTAGTLVSAINASTTTVVLSDSGAVGVGDLIQIGTERMVVQERALIDTGINAAGGLTLSDADRALVVADGTQFHSWEELTIDAEQLLVQAVAGNTLIVKRAVNGSVLAAHSIGADIYARRQLTVLRGAVGSTAAIHAQADPATRWLPPALIEQLCRAEAIVGFSQGQAGYSETSGAGAAARDTPGPGIDQLRYDAYTRYGRQARKTAI